VSDTKYAGQTLIFSLHVGLKMHEIQPVDYSLTVRIAQLQTTIPEFRTIQSQISANYFIGLANNPMELSQYYFVQDGFRI